MPSHLVPMNEDIFDKWVDRATRVRQVVRISARAPWQGYTPDLPPDQASPTCLSGIRGLVARADPDGHGEVLMHDAGFAPLDSANLPLTTATGETAVTMLAQFRRTTSLGARTLGSEYADPTILALVGGDGSTAGTAELWRLLPSAGTWEEVPYSANGAAGADASADRDFLSDWAEFPAGCPGRSADSGIIAEPVFVWCNLADQVQVYPVADGVVTIENGAYEPLTDQFGDDFRARTVEAFGGRLYFGCTMESGTLYRQRIRRTALFTADPVVTAGAGAFDIREFGGDLLRLEKLGDLMVAYFADGVAFVRTTDVATAPDRVQLLREKRGLLGTHAVVSVGASEHFGIFDDGWYFLDPSGRWTEAGIQTVEGIQIPKWKETFYQLCDLDKRDRIVVSYDSHFIRIAFTAVGETDNERVWTYDPRGDRVFADYYPVTCWGEADTQIQAAVLWNELTAANYPPSGTWADLPGTWADFAARFGLKNLIHGNLLGDVVAHNYGQSDRWDSNTRSLESATFDVTSMLSAGGDPTSLKTATKMWVEQVNSGTKNVTMMVGGDTSEGREFQTVYWSPSDQGVGDITTTWCTFNFTATQLYFRLTGFHPVRIRSVHLDVAVGESQERYPLTL